MKILLGAVGFVLGSIVQFPFAIMGAVIGWLLGSNIEREKEFVELKQIIEDLRNEFAQLENTVVRLAKQPFRPSSTESEKEENKTYAPPTFATPQEETKTEEPSVPSDTRAFRIYEKPKEVDTERMAPSHSVPDLGQGDEDSSENEVLSSPSWFTTFFTTGNVFAKVGAILLFFGVAFLLKLVSEMGLFPIEARLLSCALGANVLIILGWRLRTKNEEYALILQGTGFGVFFLTIFGAFRIWNLLPAQAAIIMLILATTLFSLLAILQNSQVLAAMAVTGGFSAPILISTGSGNHVALFSYYGILNCAIIGMARYKSWRELNLIGFLFTYGVGGIWGAKYYVPEHFASVEPFLIFHFVLYIGVVLLFSKLKFAMEKTLVVDGPLVFGVPVMTFLYQAAMLKDTRYGIAISAAALGLFYVSLATVLYRKVKEDIRVLVEAFLASGLVFNTIAIPYALSHVWTGSVWAIEGALLVWWGSRNQRIVARYFGFGLQILAYVAFFVKPLEFETFSPLLNPGLIGSLVLFGSALYLAHRLFKKSGLFGSAETGLLYVFLFMAFSWWFFAWINEVGVWFNPARSDSDALLFRNLRDYFKLVVVGFSVFLFYLVATVLAWPALTLVRYALFLAFPFFGIFSDAHRDASLTAYLNAYYLSVLLLALASGFTAFSLFRNKNKVFDWEKTASWGFLVLTYVYWLGGNFVELTAYYKASPEAQPAPEMYNIYFAGVALSALGFFLVGQLIHFPQLGLFRLLLTTAGTLAVFSQSFYFMGPYESYGWLMWGLLFTIQYLLLRSAEKEAKSFSRFQHFSSLWLFTVVAAWGCYRFGETYISAESIWKWVLHVGAAGVFTMFVLYWKEGVFPFGSNKKAYLEIGLIPHALGLTALSQFLNLTNPGKSDPLPYIPFLNPLGIVVAFSLVVLITWFIKASRANQRIKEATPAFSGFVALAVFAWATMGLIRSLHHYLSIPWTVNEIFSSHSVHSALSIFWGVLALAAMVFANKKNMRVVWIVGCGLILVVVGKLFLIDLKDTGTLQRVISFIGSGVLLLLVGYFAPIPTSKKDVSSAR